MASRNYSGGNGASGLVNGIMAGVEPGILIGNRVAQWRAARAAQKVYDAADAGAYADDAEGQAQLQADLRHANAPISARGGDDTYGQSAYNTYLDTEKLRAAQRAGSMVPDAAAPSAGNAGGGDVDYTGALTQLARSQRGLGDLRAAVGLDQASGAMAAGRNAVNTTGRTTPEGTLPGAVDQTQLAQGTSANAANYGDPAQAQTWATDAKAKGQAATTGMAGRAIATWNMHMGQIPQGAAPETKQRMMSSAVEAVMPYVQSMAKMNGYGDVQKSPSDGKYYVLDSQGNAVAALDANNIGTAISQFGDNPENILPRIQGVATRNAEEANKFGVETKGKVRDALLTAGGKAVAPDVMRAARADAVAAQSAADKMGWHVIGKTDETDASGQPTGRQTLLVQPYPGRPPVAIRLGSSTDPADQSSFSITDQNGQPLPPDQVAALSSGAQAYALAAQKATTAQQLELNQRQYMQSRANAIDVLNSFSPGQGAPAGGAMGTPAPQAPAGVQQVFTPQDVQNYQSPFPAVSAARIQIESGGDPNAVSPKGAKGLSQFTDATAREWEAKAGLPPGATSDPQINKKLGDMYQDHLISKYAAATGNQGLGIALGLAAYNFGQGNLDRALAADPNRINEVAAWLTGRAQAPAWLPEETRNYIPRIGAAMLKAQRAALPPVTGRALAGNIPPNANPKYLQ